MKEKKVYNSLMLISLNFFSEVFFTAFDFLDIGGLL